MDIAGLSMSMAMNKTQQAVGIAMLKNNMDLMKDVGAEFASMVEAAPAQSLNPPGVGGSIDIRV